MKWRGPASFFCEVDRVVDADTIRLAVDVGFRLTYRDNFRLAGIDAPELRTERGKLAKEFLEDFVSSIQLDPDAYFKVTVIKHGKYRWVADLVVYRNDLIETTISNYLVKAGWAVEKKF